ncbi:MAG TPA: CBS domain-containing protein, partial [Alphaproteobacteria bacterium]|nr:CBS domain-containing protein [Alphaproteobacteria bacterium]
GIITDRDITLRVIAAGLDPLNTRVEQVMTRHVFSCREDDTIEDAAREMRKHDVGRLVVTRGMMVTGIVNMTCLLRAHIGQHNNG